MSQRSKLTTTFWKSLVRHKNAVYQSVYGLQTVNIKGKNIVGGYEDLKKYIFDHILELRKNDINLIEKNFKARIKYESKEGDKAIKEPKYLGDAYDTFDDDNYGDLDKFYEKFKKNQENAKEDIESEKNMLDLIDISRINLIKIDETAEINAKIYPKSYHCRFCEYYVVFDDDYPGGLECPECKAKGKKIKLQQNNYVNVCPVCANIEQIAPFWEYDRDGLKLNNNNPFKCIDPKCDGNIKLHINEKYIGASYWYCSKCNLNFKNLIPGSTHEHKVVNFHQDCRIYDRAGAPPLAVKYVFNRNSARLLNPLIFEYITIKDKEISFTTLKESFDKKKKEKKVRTWELDNLEHMYLSIFKDDYNIEDVFLVGDVNIQTCCFGYESAFQDEKYAKFKRKRFFLEDKGIYNVYFFENEGNALVIKLDKKAIIEKLVKFEDFKKPDNYEEFYNSLIIKFFEKLRDEAIQDFLNDNSIEMKLFKAIHYFSHAILNAIIKKVGIDVFRTKLLLKDGVIFVYEIDRVLSGGLVQLTLSEDSGNSLFSLFCYELLPKIKECNNDCADHCQKCSFINDFYCRPLIYLENPHKRWLPPNSLISRELAKKIIIK